MAPSLGMSEPSGAALLRKGGADRKLRSWRPPAAPLLAGAGDPEFLGRGRGQARVLQEVYGSELELREGGWERLDGRYDVIHCDGLVGSEPHPARMLEHLAGLLEPGGTLLLRCLVLVDPDEAYSILMGEGLGHAFVKPGDPGCSALVVRLDTDNPILRMPPAGDPLDERERCSIRRWISDGAPR